MLLRDSRHRRPLLFTFAASSGLAALVIAVAMPPGGLGDSMHHFWWIALLSMAACGSAVLLNGLWTATGAYAVVFWCFHFGLVAVLGSGLVAPGELSPWDQSWVLGPFAADAALLALIGSLALAAGASLVRAGHPIAPTGSGSGSVSATPRAGVHPHGAAGSMLVLMAVASWCGLVALTGGTGGFFVSYSEYLQQTSGYEELVSVIWLALGCGFVMSITGKSGWLRFSAIGAFACLALIALPLGLRSEILFPCIAALVAWARCGQVLSSRSVCAFAVMLLVLIPVVRDVRAAGVGNLSQAVFDVRPFDAFAEMGGSLHPVEKVVRWHDEGEGYEHGRSYWAPIERAARRLLPGLPDVAAEDDRRIMNVLVAERVGAIGFSPVAEAYRNFGATGVVVVFVVLGAILASLDGITNRKIAVLSLATVYVPLLINVRNSFIAVPAQCAAGILTVVGLAVMRHMVAVVMCRPYARAPYIRSAI